ncbi:hypothetical protein M0P65_02675 [Candidatus Gracilibacteria bacterium]|nr:hypothetical protein [Candidatus Gracilibacteria bacterium]
MNEVEIGVKNDQNSSSSIINFLRQNEKLMTRAMVVILTTLLVWIVRAGLHQPFGYNTGLAILITLLLGAIFGSTIIGTTTNKVVAGMLGGGISALVALSVFFLLVSTNIVFFDIENIVLLFGIGVWGVLMFINDGLYRNYESYYIPFLLFISIPSLWIIFFLR